MIKHLRVPGNHMKIMEVLAGQSGLYGMQIAKIAHISSTQIYVYLSRMGINEWVYHTDEENPVIPDKPRKKYFLTLEGRRVYQAASQANIHYANYAEGVTT